MVTKREPATKVNYTFNSYRPLTTREAELLCRVMQRAARDQMAAWEAEDAGRGD